MSAHRSFGFTVAAAALVASAGCFEPSLGPENLADAAVLVINASPSTLDVVVDGDVLYPELAPSLFTYHIPIRSGPRVITLRTPSGQTATSAVNVSQLSTVMIVGRSPAGAATLEAQVLPDTNAVAVIGKGKLRVAHLAPGAPRLDVWRTQPDFEDSVRVMNPFEYPAVSPYLMSDPGVWRVWATPLATTGTDTILADTGPIDVPGATLVTVALLDSAGVLRFRVIE